MRQHVRHAALLTAFIALAGCQSFGFSTKDSAPAGSSANFLPGLSNAPIDGKGPSQMLELPLKEKIEVCLATAQQMEKKGSIPEAINYYEQIRELDPKRQILCTRHLAVLYDRKGDFEKALDEYGKLLKANPKDADAHNDLGYGYYSRGQFEAAEKQLRLAVEFDPKGKRAWTNFGMALAQIGKYQEAVAAFEHSVSKPQAFCNVGCIQFAQGKRTEAADSFAMALKLEPGLDKARVALERMNDGPNSKRNRERQEESRRHREMLEQVDKNAARGLPFGMPQGLAGGEADMVARIVDLPPEGTATTAAAPPLSPAPNAATSTPLPTLPQALPSLPSTPLSVD